MAGELINNLNDKNDPFNKDEKQEAISKLFEVLENKKIDLKPAKADSLD